MPDLVCHHVETAFEKGWSRTEILMDIERLLPDYVSASHNLIDQLERHHELLKRTDPLLRNRRAA